MAELKSANSARPSSLKSPVPKAATADDLLADFAPAKLPTVEAASSPAPTAEALAADFQPEGTPPGDDQFAQEPGFIQANIEQFKPNNLVDRLQAGLAANDQEKTAFLQKKYGKENVAQKNGKIYFRRDASEKLRPLDPATFELVSDIIPDFAREIVTETSMLPGEIAGAAGGTVAAGPAGAAGGALMGRVASVPFANKVADSIAAGMGVEADPSRNQRTENMIGMAVEGTLPIVGKAALKQVAKRIPGTLAYKSAREAGEREVVALAKQSQEVLQAADALEKEGLRLNLTLEQVQPDSPAVKKLTDKASRYGESGAFLNKQQEFAEGAGAAIDNTIKEVKRLVNPNGPVPGNKIGQKITSVIDDLDRAEGERIGEFRRKALAATGNKKAPLPQGLNKNVKELMTELGFVPRTQRIQSYTRGESLGMKTPSEDMANIKLRDSLMASRTGPRSELKPKLIERQIMVPPKDLQSREGIQGLDASQLRSVVNVLNEYGQVMSRGGEARLTDVERLIKRMGPLNNKLRGSALGGRWGAMTAELRQHRRGMIEAGLEKDIDKKLYNSAMDEFSLIRSNTENLQGLFDKDMSAKALTNYFFSPSADQARIESLKKILGDDAPALGALKEEWINELTKNHVNKAGSKTGFNSAAMLKDLTKNEAVAKEIFGSGPGPNLDTVKNLLTVAERIESIQRTAKAESMSNDAKKGAIDVLLGWAGGIRFKMLNGAQRMLGVTTGEEKALFEVLNREGFEKYLANYKGKGDKRVIARNIEAMLSQYNAARVGSKKVEALTNVGKEIGLRGTRATIREDIQR